ncbi:SIMPL domain-containing protein [Sphingomonas sp. GCM10030256]|uniref:SIMPL domain-containing protein n=1 Tax=Sphingomonas sp. GCM10030256 TaxID=3273427 RepID=UPI0036122662
MKSLVAFALLLGGGAAIAQTPATAISPLGPNSALLSISAEGRSRRTPDLAIFNAGVVTQGRTAAEAIAGNSRRMEAVIAGLRRSGVADRDIQTAAISLQPRYSDPEREAQIRARELRQPYVPPAQPDPPRIIGYEARNNVQVHVRRLGEMGRIIDTLIESGANQVDGPSFTLDDSKAALDEARVEAVATGRQRAELYARAAGMRVARILSISEGGGVYPVQEIVVTGSRMGGYGAPPPPPPPTPVAPGELTLGTSVSMQFELTR